MDAGKQSLQRQKSHVSVRTKDKELPKTGFSKKLYSFTKYVENYQRQIFWVTLYVLVSIGIFLERAHCKYHLVATYFLTCAPNEDSNQPAHPRSLIRDFVVHMEFAVSASQNATSEDSDQNARMRRLI